MTPFRNLFDGINLEIFSKSWLAHSRLLVLIFKVQGVYKSRGYSVLPSEGIYAWKGRHTVISEIIKKFKFDNEPDLLNLFDKVIENTQPIFKIERNSLNEICDIERGIPKLSKVSDQNLLYRKIINKAPMLRPPRHRLIRNLIKGGRYQEALDEISVFGKEIGLDGPCYRYKASVELEYADSGAYPLSEDKAVVVKKAAAIVEQGLARFRNDSGLHKFLAEVGLKYLKLTGDWKMFDDAILKFRSLSDATLDPEISRTIGRFEARAKEIQSGI